MAKAVAAREAGDLTKAIAKAEKAISLDPNNARAHFIHVMSLLAQGGSAPELWQASMPAAIASMERFIVLDPNSEAAAMFVSYLVQLTGKAPLLSPRPVACSEDAEANYMKAEVLFSQQDMAGASAAYVQALEACPGNPTWCGPIMATHCSTRATPRAP
jgi:tetratricopeptide (TPR) repeat protein